jgi:organic hydroperoxide reductase OsmC/OhrA
MGTWPWISCDRRSLAAEIPTVSREEAQALVEKAHAVCPYSDATRGNVNARLIVTES